jgi:hypothetical protein
VKNKDAEWGKEVEETPVPTLGEAAAGLKTFHGYNNTVWTK